MDYFLLDPDVPDQKRRDALIAQFKELYGEKPKVIKIMFPPASPELFFAQFYKRYGKGALLKCKGDGEVAETTAEFAEGLEQIGETERGFLQVVCKGPDCPYQKSNECGRMASLQVILPELSGIGVWQINTGSYNSIVNINSALEWLTGLCGRFAMIPIKLMRQEQDIAYEGKRSKHYILAIDQQISIGEIQKFASLTPVERALIPAPDEKKDELFYAKNGERPQLPAPDEEKASQEAPQATISDEAKPQDPVKPEAEKKEKGPLSKAFEEEQAKRAFLNNLKDIIKTHKTKKDVVSVCNKMKTSGDIDKLDPKQQAELKGFIASYMRGLKE